MANQNQKPKREIRKGKVNVKSQLNFRKSPEVGDNLLPQGPIVKGKFVDILSEKEVDGVKWYRIKYEGRVGYVMAKFIDII
jgi:hypothetical protein